MADVTSKGSDKAGHPFFLLKTANGLDRKQSQQNVGPNLDQNCLTP